MTQQAPSFGRAGRIYRSRARNIWTPTGTNVPDYPNMVPCGGRCIEGRRGASTRRDRHAQFGQCNG